MLQLPRCIFLISLFLAPFGGQAQEWPSDTSIDTLVLFRKNLKVLTDDICQYKQLTYLDLTRNKLEELPSCLADLPLETLILEKNKFSIFPPILSQIKTLKTLNLGRNVIDTIPEWIPELPQLERLELFNNDISYFPRNLSQAKSLKVVDLSYAMYNIEEMNYVKGEFPEIEFLFSQPCGCPSATIILY